MQFGPTDQPPKVPAIFRDDNTILGDASREHTMIRLAAAAGMQGVNRVVSPGQIESQGQLRRQALIDEQPHTARAHGRPPGRPISGWVRA